MQDTSSDEWAAVAAGQLVLFPGLECAPPRCLPDGWQPLLDAFAAELSMDSACTERNYARAVARLAVQVGVSPDSVLPEHVQAWAYGRTRQGRPPAPSTVRVRLCGIDAFYRFAARQGRPWPNPAASVKRPKPSQPAHSIPDERDWQRIIEALPYDATRRHVRWAAWRARAILFTLAFSALRRAEMWQVVPGTLRQQDVTLPEGDTVRRWVATIKRKGGRVQAVELPRPAMEAIADWLEVAGERLDAMHPNRSIWGCTEAAFAGYLYRLGVRLGLPLGCHRFRHLAAQQRALAGQPVNEIQMLLGHASLRTLAIYLNSRTPPIDRWADEIEKRLGRG